jgi:hypothetical protein
MVNVFDHCSARANGAAARQNPKITDAILCIPCPQPGQIPLLPRSQTVLRNFREQGSE